MSYRAFKRLLGEYRLERKCRYFFGAFNAILLTGSFYLYHRQTESLAYDQIKTACRVLVNEIVERQLATVCRPDERGPAREEDKKRLVQSMDEFYDNWKHGFSYKHYIFKPNATRQQDIPDPASLERIKAFQLDADKREDNYLDLSAGHNNYYGAVRATESCLGCHRRQNADLQEGDLLAVVKIEVDTQPIEAGFHTNRAILISIAFSTAVLIMVGSYLIVRYVIVKPVKHLKEVSDAISAGELNVRSEIQTGDEFEDLSHAFNRMLRNLVSMQDRLRKVNADLDRKVDELAQANLALYESNRLKSDFLATMSHELRTPLNSILGFSEVLLSSNGLSEKQARWVANIQSSGQQLLNLINDILDLAKIEAGKMQVRLVEFSIYDVCDGMLAMFRPLAEKKNIDLRGVLATGIPLLRQDVVKFQQILSNLLSNAIKFTPEGGRVQLKAEVDSLGAARRPLERWRFSRADRHRYRRRHRPGRAGTDLREVPASGQPADAPARRHRPGVVHRPRAVEATGRGGVAAKRTGPRQHLHGTSAVAVERGAAPGVRSDARRHRSVEAQRVDGGCTPGALRCRPRTR